MKIEFIPNNNQVSHKDIHIKIPELDINKFVDSYYFAIDIRTLPNEETDEKVIIILNNLLREWIDNIDQLQEGDSAFLPYDFSDQYIGGIKAQRQGYNVIIRSGWNRQMGGMNPSDYNKGYLKDEDLILNIASAAVPLEKFINDIKDQIHSD